MSAGSGVVFIIFTGTSSESGLIRARATITPAGFWKALQVYRFGPATLVPPDVPLL